MIYFFRRLVPSLSLISVLAGLSGVPGCGGDGDDLPASSRSSSPDRDAGKVKPDAKASSVPDTGASPRPEAGVEPQTNTALDALAGRYLMRFDTFGTATTGLPPLVVSIRSRVSLLFVTELVVDGDKLRATERLCQQTAKQKCLDDTCGTASTVVDPRVAENFLRKTQFTREYALSADGKSIAAGESIAALGYVGDGPLPTSSGDQSVWDVDTSKGPREGMLTKLSVTNVGLGGSISCEVYGVQKFVTKFSGALVGSASQPAFPTMELEFGAASAAGTLGSTSAACDAAGDSPLDRATVQLVRHGADDDDEFWDCYDVDVFEAELPAPPDDVIDAP